jgi:predicted naringenin-chalcone synthase
MAANTYVLTDFRIRRPRYRVEQRDSLAWLAKAHARAAKTAGDAGENFGERIARVIDRVGCNPKQIGARASELRDVTHDDFAAMEVYALEAHPRGAGMGARMAAYERAADSHMDAFYEGDTTAPDDLIHVTCTGYVSPSSAQKLVSRRGFPTRVTHAYHMGCYAAMPALRIAQGFGAAGRARVDIVHTELCTLHLDPSQHSPEQLVVQSLFADGFVRYSLVTNANARGLEVIALDEAILPDSTQSMSWVCSEWGMRMTLARDVPDRIAGELTPFLQRLFAAAGRNFADERASAVFAVHPGGPKIIDRVRDVLTLAEGQLTHSRGVLFDHGNMSSATLPHVWERIVGDTRIAPGTLVASLAFGPGLTVCGGLMVKT